MALDKERLTGKIKAAFSQYSTESNIDKVSADLAQAIIDEIKQLKITYTSGLVNPGGAVTGTFGNDLD